MDDLEAAALRADSASLFQAGATFRRVVNGIAFTHKGVKRNPPYCGAFTALRTSQEQDSQGGGFAPTASCTLRVQRSANCGFKPTKGDLITRSDTGATLRVADIADNGIAPEIVLTLADPHH